MFLRIVLFAMIFSVIYARNPEHGDDRVPSWGTPCPKEEPSHHHQRDIQQAAALNDKNLASSMIIPVKNNNEQPYPLRMHLKKSAENEPKPGCCG